MKITPVLNHKSNKEGKNTIFIRIVHNQKSKMISVGYAVFEKDWNADKKEVRKTEMLYSQINSVIKSMVLEAEHEALQAKIHQKPMSAAQLQAKIKNEIGGSSFIEFAQKRIGFLRNVSTRDAQQAVLNKFKRFLKEKDLLFHELDYDLIKQFKRYLEDLGNGINTIHNNLKTLKAAFNEAIVSGAYEGANPWLRIKLQKQKSNRRKLSTAEIKAIETIEIMPNTVMYNARAAYMLSFYLQGMRVADLLRLRWSNIYQDRCEYTAGKTAKTVSKKMPPAALAILDYFKALKKVVKPADYLLPFLKKEANSTTPHEFQNHIESKTTQINNELYDIADKLGIKRFSMHTARHTFADIAIRQSGGNIHAVSDALGHSSISTTENYFNSATKDENDALGDLVFGGRPTSQT